jgi:hypothetical protein
MEALYNRRMRPSSADGPAIPLDTSEEAARLQVEIWRRMTSLEKAELVSAATRAVEELCLEGIRLRHPGASEEECRLRLAIIKLGPELAVEVYPEAASLLDGPL